MLKYSLGLKYVCGLCFSLTPFRFLLSRTTQPSAFCLSLPHMHTRTYLNTEGHIYTNINLTKTDKPLLASGRQRIVRWWSTRAILYLEQRVKHAFKELVIKCEAWGLERWILLDRLFPGLSSSKLLGLELAREDWRDRKVNLFPCDVGRRGEK